jgi:hypothetical protein
MLRRHLAALAAITKYPSLVYRVRQYFFLDSSPLLVALRRAGLCQADVVLALSRIGTRAARTIAEGLIGKSITIGPSCKFVYNYNRARPLIHTQPTISRVLDLSGCRAKSRLSLCLPHFQVGRTLEQLTARGVRRGDIKRAVRRGMIIMTEAK